MIRSLIRLAKYFPQTDELREYIRFASLSDKDISRKMQVIEKINEFRKR